MANSVQPAAKNTSKNYKPNPYSTAIVNENNIRNSLALKQSVFFNTADKADGKVHVQLPRYVSAATNKVIPAKDGVYIAQAFKNMGITTGRVITSKGAAALGTTINPNSPHVEVKGVRKLTESGIAKKGADEERLQKLIEQEKDEKVLAGLKHQLETTVKERTTGYEDIITTYYPANKVEDTRKLANAFINRSTGNFNQKNLNNYMNENLKENQFAKGPAIDGDKAKDWKEHVKNCLTGREVVLSKEKAKELSSSMLNDLQNNYEQNNYFAFQKTVKEKSEELHKEAVASKERAQEIDMTPDKIQENQNQSPDIDDGIEVF